ncbi:hypothetical protein P4S72_01495 [Vibrio sp. PP-XX7]
MITSRKLNDESNFFIRLKNPWHLLATGFGSGLSPVMPGTMGTFASISFLSLQRQLPFTPAISSLPLSLSWGLNLSENIG